MNDKQFGNGRVCRTIIENAVNMQSSRLIDVEEVSDNELMTLNYEDFEFLGEDKSFGAEKNYDLGFKAA